MKPGGLERDRPKHTQPKGGKRVLGRCMYAKLGGIRNRWPNPRTLGATMVKLILIALFALPLAACGGLGATERYHDNGWRHGGGYYYHQHHWDHRHRDW